MCIDKMWREKWKEAGKGHLVWSDISSSLSQAFNWAIQAEVQPDATLTIQQLMVGISWETDMVMEQACGEGPSNDVTHSAWPYTSDNILHTK